MPNERELPAVSASSGLSDATETLQLSLTRDCFSAAAAGGTTPLRDGSRFRLLRFHAQGGLGVVHLAEDLELQRSVAYKQIKPTHPDTADTRRRFLLEAEITGKLEHPGVVPVYGLVADEVGRPAYAMRFIQGETLADAIHAFHAGPPSSPTREAFAGVKFRQLLSRFVAVCNTIAFAHSRGIIHRDIKPSNLMLGSYGESLVLDWGLARPFDHRTGVDPSVFAADELLRPTLSSNDGSQTQMGAAVGTPAYMAPEQAEGRWDAVGPAADVYSLGATLYSQLTDTKPFSGNDVEEVLKAVRRGKFVPPREINSHIPKPLAAICLHAMALTPQARYASALELAQDIEHYLADEPVAAYRESFRERTRRWARRHRALVTAVAASLLVGVLGLGIATSLLTAANGRERLARNDAEVQRERAEDNERDAQDSARLANQQRTLANQQRDRAERENKISLAVRGFLQRDLLRMADARQQADALRQAGDNSTKLLENPTIKDLLDRAAAELTLEKIEEKFPAQPLVQAEILRTVGETYWGTGDFAKAIDHLERSRGLYADELGADHDDTLHTLNNLALAYRAAGQPLRAIRLYEQSRELQANKRAADDPETLITLHNLAFAYREAGKLPEAVRLMEQVRDLRTAKLGPHHPQTLTTLNNLGLAYRDVGRLPEAIRLFEDLHQRRVVVLGADDPTTLVTLVNLAFAHRTAGNVPEAIRLYEQVVNKLAAALGPGHPQTLSTMNNLAVAYGIVGQRERSLTIFEQVLVKQKDKLGPEHPSTLLTLLNLGSTCRDLGRLKEAVRYLEEAAAAVRRRPGPLPAPLATLPHALADTYDRANEPAKAEPLHRGILAQARKQFGAEDQRTLSALLNLGQNLLKQDKPAEAEPLLRESLAIGEEIQADDWRTFGVKFLLGTTLWAQKKHAEAEPLLLAGYEGMKRREASIPQSQQGRLTESLEQLAGFYDAVGKPVEAAKWRKELERAKQK